MLTVSGISYSPSNSSSVCSTLGKAETVTKHATTKRLKTSKTFIFGKFIYLFFKRTLNEVFDNRTKWKTLMFYPTCARAFIVSLKTRGIPLIESVPGTRRRFFYCLNLDILWLCNDSGVNLNWTEEQMWNSCSQTWQETIRRERNCPWSTRFELSESEDTTTIFGHILFYLRYETKGNVENLVGFHFSKKSEHSRKPVLIVVVSVAA